MKRIGILLIAIFLLLVNTKPVFAVANSKSKNKGIPESVLKKIQSKIDANEDEIPEINAWETDLNGNTVGVTPLGQRKNQTSFITKYPETYNNFIKTTPDNSITPYAVPSDGYIYIFSRYISQTAKKNWYYDDVGTFRFSNQTSQPVPSVQYTQESTEQTKWSVSGSIQTEAKIGTSFIGEVGVKLGVTVARDKTWYSGNKYGATYSVPARTVYYLTNYQVGANSNGYLLYNKYHSSGASAGVYTESAGGTGINKTDVSIELTDYEPIN